MITYLVRLIWALVFNIIYIFLIILVSLYYFLFDIKELKLMIKDDVLGLFTITNLSESWIVWDEEGEWKTIWHWALKIKQNEN